MRKTIEEIWNGNIDPSGEVGVNNDEIKKVLGLIESNNKRLEAVLSENYKPLLEKFRDCYEEYSVLLTEQAFCDGFCLAVKIMSEAMIN